MMLTQILIPDIKPENILLQANGYLLLSDFGVAKILQDVEDCRSTSGTHGYMVTKIEFEVVFLAFICITVMMIQLYIMMTFTSRPQKFICLITDMGQQLIGLP
jgi:hypothetical protein